MEIWKDITGHEGLYIISNYARIKNCKKGNIIKHLNNGRGYYRVRLFKNKIYTTFYVHRLVAVEFIPKLKGKNIINHKDGNPANNRIENLEWCTQLENIRHSIKTGLAVIIRGEEIGNSKLKETQVIQIRRLQNSGFYTYLELSKLYSVCISTIGKIINRKIWTHI